MTTRERLPGAGCGRSAGAAPRRSSRWTTSTPTASSTSTAIRSARCRGPPPPGSTRSCEEEWGRGLIRSWNTAGWITLSQRIGDKIARLVGAGPGELTVADSTSVNLYKVLSAAIALVAADAPGRRRIVSERTNFPTDLYIADTLARAHGFELTLVDAADLPAHLDERAAVLHADPCQLPHRPDAPDARVDRAPRTPPGR